MEFHFNNWLIYFYFYCIFGWIFESTYVSIRTHKLTNRGFMKGPWLPIYGSGAVIILLTTLSFVEYPLAVYFVGAISATVLEYFTGAAMVKIFKVRYWDYSDRKIQLHGHICLSSTIAWGFLSLLVVFVIHKPVVRFIGIWDENFLNICTFLVTIFMVSDFTNSFREAMDLRKLIIQTEDIVKHMAAVLEEEREQIRERMKETKEQLAQSVEQRKEGLTKTAENRREQIVESVEKTKEQIGVIAETYKLQKEENAEIRKFRLEEKKKILQEKREILLKKMELHSKQLLLNNPNSSFANLKEDSKEIRKRLLEKRKSKK